MGRKYISEWRSEHDLPPQPRGMDILHRSDGTPIPVLHGFSCHVAPEPPDWPERVVTTGYWFLERHTSWEPSTALETFLESGEPPVYIGFGSMARRNPQRVAHVVIEALQQAKLRGVLATGWGGLTADSLPQSVFMLDQVPHDPTESWCIGREDPS